MEVVKKIVKNRKANPPEHGEELMLDKILDYSEDEVLQFSDSITFTVGGFHTTGNCEYYWTFTVGYSIPQAIVSITEHLL